MIIATKPWKFLLILRKTAETGKTTQETFEDFKKVIEKLFSAACFFFNFVLTHTHQSFQQMYKVCQKLEISGKNVEIRVIPGSKNLYNCWIIKNVRDIFWTKTFEKRAG